MWILQICRALALLCTVVVIGGVLINRTTSGQIGFWEAAYFSLITVSTVGFGEPEALAAYPKVHWVVAGLIVFGVGALAFFESSLTAALVQNAMGKALRKRTMRRKISHLTDHIIVAGCGRTGQCCVHDLFSLKRRFVVIDQSIEVLENMNQECAGKLLFMAGDATDDEVLLAAGVEKASGMIAALSVDKDNVFAVLSARALNDNLHIVSKVLAKENEPKLIKAGAQRLVSPHQIGGSRLVSELVRPQTMQFLDGVHANTESDLRMEDVTVSNTSNLVGASLVDSGIRKTTNALIVAIRLPAGTLQYNPTAEHVLVAGSQLIAVGDAKAIDRLRTLAES